MSRSSHLAYLIRILGLRAALGFGAVTLAIVFLLAAVQIASRYALKEYVEDQLGRVAWDLSVYQTSDLPLAGDVRSALAGIENVTETQNIFFLRTAVPASTLAYVDGLPLRSPWLSVLSVTDIDMLPSDIRPAAGRAVLVLVGSKAQMGDAFLQLQNKRRFQLKIEKGPHSAQVFDAALERTVRIDRNELNRWFMDQTSSPTLVPELGVILVAPYDPKMLRAFDAVSRGLKHSHNDEEDKPGADDIHAEAGEYFPDIVHLARVNRAALVSGWDVEASHARLQALGEKLRGAAQQVSFRVGLDNTSGVLFERMSQTARLVGLVSLLAALPLLLMTWVLLANLSALLLLSERRKLGLLRLRGVPGEAMGRSLLIAIGAGGTLGGVAGAAAGTLLPIRFYAGGWLPWELLLKVQNPGWLLLCVVIGVGLSLWVARRLVRYVATISPLEASGRIASSEAQSAAVRFGVWQAIVLLLAAVKVAGWVLGGSFADAGSPAWLRAVDRALDFIAFPFFVYGATMLVASRSAWLSALLRPLTWLFGGRLREASLQHMATRRHRVSGLLLIVALLASLSLYPTVMTAVFDNKTQRAALVQLGAPLQVTLNTPDLVPAAALARGGLKERYALIAGELRRLAERLGALPEVQSVSTLAEGLIDGLYMPGSGFSSIPLYLVEDPAAYLKSVYHEEALGQSAPFTRLIGELGADRLLSSSALAGFMQRPVGGAMPAGRDTGGALVQGTHGGVLHLIPGMPLAAVKDRDSFLGARVDYLNYLFDNRAYLVSAARNPNLAALDALVPRVVLSIAPKPGVAPAELRRAVLSALPVEPLQVRELDEEVARLGSDMYIFLARRNVQIYLLGGMLMALIGIVAVALSNYAEDRRTLALLRIRGCGPRELLQFLAAGLSAPAAAGLAFGAATALLVGYGITNLVWRLRELRTLMMYLKTQLAVSMQTAWVGAFLILSVVAVLALFSRWMFRRTAREALSER